MGLGSSSRLRRVALLQELELADLLGEAREPVEVEVEALEAGETPCKVGAIRVRVRAR